MDDDTGEMTFRGAARPLEPIGEGGTVMVCGAPYRVTGLEFAGGWVTYRIEPEPGGGMPPLRDYLHEEVVWPGAWRLKGQEYETPFFNVFREEGRRFAAAPREKRLAEAQDRCEWIEGVRRTLGLVTEIHRCEVRHVREGFAAGMWAWSCLRETCLAEVVSAGLEVSQAEAFAGALAHTRSFVPDPPEPQVLSHLDWTVLASFHDYISGVAVPPLVGAGPDLTGWGPQA